jgi:hypothetical protein
MSKVLITGSADGLGREAAKQLVRGGHEVVLHARDEARAQQALADAPGAAAAFPGDLSSITSTRALADLINAAGVFDAVLAAAVARRWPDVVSSSVEPGWVRTKMGGRAAPGEIGPGAETQVWLATSSDPLARQSGRHSFRGLMSETWAAEVRVC